MLLECLYRLMVSISFLRKACGLLREVQYVDFSLQVACIDVAQDTGTGKKLSDIQNDFF